LTGIPYRHSRHFMGPPVTNAGRTKRKRTGLRPAPCHFQTCSPAYATGCAFFAARDSLYFLSNLSMRPAVSINFCLPVKKGWQEEQISTRMSPLCVERVLNVWAQAQVTLISL